MVVPTITTNRAITPRSTPRFGGNDSLPDAHERDHHGGEHQHAADHEEEVAVHSGADPTPARSRSRARCAHDLVGELERVSAPDQQSQGALSLALVVAAHAPIVQQRHGPLELGLGVLALERSLDVGRATPRPSSAAEMRSGPQPASDRLSSA